MNPEFSVVVCTYNRADMLRGCLESLCQQTLARDKYEILVVDNNSEDNTRSIVDAFAEEVNLHYVREFQPGLSNARNRGFRESTGHFVAYIDDDARAAGNWLEVADDVLKQLDGKADCLGGPYHPFYTSSKPPWFRDEYEIRALGNAAKYLEKGQYISGSNMIWSREILDKIGGFDNDTGVIGERLRLGEETRALDTLWQLPKRPQVFYSPELIIYHWVPDSKMRVPYRLKRKFAEGLYRGDQLRSTTQSSRLGLLSKTILAFARASIRFLPRVRSHLGWRNWIAEDGGRVAFWTGQLSSLLGIRPHLSRGE